MKFRLGDRVKYLGLLRPFVGRTGIVDAIIPCAESDIIRPDYDRENLTVGIWVDGDRKYGDYRLLTARSGVFEKVHE